MACVPAVRRNIMDRFGVDVSIVIHAGQKLEGQALFAAMEKMRAEMLSDLPKGGAAAAPQKQEEAKQILEKEGYIFKGWYESNTFEGESIDRISSTDSGDKTFYAKWLQQFTITYDTRGGFLNETAKTVYTEGDTYSLETPYQSSDSFEGWYLTPDFQGDPIENITPETKGNLTLYAKWSSDNKKEKCGKKNSALILNLLAATSLLAVLLKKKK